MSRIILDATKSIGDLYIVSDSYIRKCENSAIILNQHLSDYIDHSAYFQILIDTNKDIFDSTKIDDFRTNRTDGSWFWSADLNFYTQKHNFIWPNNFLTHIKNTKIRTLSFDELYEISEKINNTLFNANAGVKFEKEEMITCNIINL